MADTARDLARRAGAEGAEHLGEYRSQAAETVDHLADSVDKAAAEIADGDDALNLSRHLADLAGGMHAISRSVKEKSADALLGDVNRIARESPALFLGGAAALGFALTRLLKASAHGSRASSSSDAPDAPFDPQNDGDESRRPVHDGGVDPQYRSSGSAETQGRSPGPAGIYDAQQSDGPDGITSPLGATAEMRDRSGYTRTGSINVKASDTHTGSGPSSSNPALKVPGETQP